MKTRFGNCLLTARWSIFLVLVAAVFTLCSSTRLFAGDAPSSGPRPGKYRIISYGAVAKAPLFLGYFVLAGNTYKAYLPGDKLSGQGQWKCDSAAGKVVWTSGPYAGVWGGDFIVEREGKTHKIRLKSGTIATNNSDSK